MWDSLPAGERQLARAAAQCHALPLQNLRSLAGGAALVELKHCAHLQGRPRMSIHILSSCHWRGCCSWLLLVTATLPFPACTGATPDMRVFREEVFGPVTPVFKFSSEDGEAQRMGACQARHGLPGPQRQFPDGAGSYCYMPRCCLRSRRW